MIRFINMIIAGSVLTAVLLIPSLTSARSNDETRLDFDVFLNEKKIGTHYFELQSEDGIYEVKSVANFKYTVFFIPAYRYQHNNNEVWQDNCLMEFNARTNANGKEIEVSGSQDGEVFRLAGDADESQLPECIMTFAYWNPDFLSQRQLLNQQTGEYVDVQIEQLGTESLEVRGEAVTANRFKLTSPDAQLTLWYSAENEWLALESVAKGGHIIRYELS